MAAGCHIVTTFFRALQILLLTYLLYLLNYKIRLATPNHRGYSKHKLAVETQLCLRLRQCPSVASEAENLTWLVSYFDTPRVTKCRLERGAAVRARRSHDTETRQLTV